MKIRKIPKNPMIWFIGEMKFNKPGQFSVDPSKLNFDMQFLGQNFSTEIGLIVQKRCLLDMYVWRIGMLYAHA